MFKAVKMLSSTYKLCLTGTPFVNRPQDIQSLLSFLGALPLAKTSVFKQFVVKKIKERKEVGMKVLRAALAHVSLRRRKDFVADSVKLVARTIHVQAIPFDDGPHKDIHDALYEGGKPPELQQIIVLAILNVIKILQPAAFWSACFNWVTMSFCRITCILLH